MQSVNKLLLFILFISTVIVFVELGYLFYLKYFSPGFTSLSSVTYRKDYETWLAKNSLVTYSRLVNPDKDTHLIVNNTEGKLKSFVPEKDQVVVAIQTPSGPISYTFLRKGFKTYRKPANTTETLVPIDESTLRNGDKVVIHESYMIVGDKIKNTDNGIVKLE